MSIKNIITQCIELNIKLSAIDGNLKVDAPKGAMTQTLLQAIKENKAPLLAFLAEHGADKAKQVLQRIYPQQQNGVLSSGQSQMWLLDQAYDDNDNYQFYRVLHLEGSIDLETLQQALASIIARHTVLRTTYHETEKGIEQRINGGAGFNLEQLDVSRLASDLQSAQIDDAAAAFNQSGFVLSQDTMLKALLVKTADSQFQLHIKFHHIACDGWSIGLIVRDLTELYGNTDGEQNAAVYQYIDYAAWQQSEEIKNKVAKDLPFFTEYLAQAPQLHNLPVQPGQRKDLYQIGHIRKALPNDLSSNLKDYCQSNNVTLFSFLQLTLALTIARYSNSDDVLMGTPMANRPMLELAEVVGYFVNTLPLRAKWSSGQSFEEVLKAHHFSLLEVMEKQHVPFDEIVKQSVNGRTPGASPLVQIMFTLQNNDIPDLRLGDAKITVATPSPKSMELDLNIECIEQDGGLTLDWHYAADLFPGSLMNNMLSHFEQLLQRALEQPKTAMAKLDMLSDEQQQYLIEGMNQVSADYPKDQCIHTLFEQQVANNPDKIAVSFGTLKLSYRQLNEQANRLAHYLKENCAVSSGTLVGLCVQRSLDMMVGILAILKAGGAYVPMDPGYPRERLNYLLQDTGVEVVLSQTQVMAVLADFGGTIVTLDGVADTGSSHFCRQYPTHNLALDYTGANASSLAYVIYTSGSTGKPKGVLTPHIAVARLVINQGFMTLNSDTIMMQCANIAFDAATLELWGPLLNGGHCVLYSQAYLSPELLNEAIETHQVNSLWLTAGFFSQWAQQLPGKTSLKQLLAGGDTLALAAIKRVQQALPELTLINGYGPTENTTFSTTHTFDNPHKSMLVPIGRRLDSDEVYVLDNALQLVPYGVEGELYVGGDGLAQGYLNSPELTAERFIDNPFNPNGSKRLYRTGDLVRYLEDGTLAFIGRADNQVKIRGFRIEPGEIENQLTAMAQVDSALVLVKTVGANKQLVAYVKPVAQAFDAEQTGQILAALKASLPEYMVPAFLLAVEQWPLTANGKIDRSKLPEPDGSHLQGEYVAPKTAMEQVLVDTWAELLEIDAQSISTAATFYELGGHSLLAINTQSKLKSQGYFVSIADILEPIALAQLAQRLRGERSADVFVAPTNAIVDGQAITPADLNLIELSDEELQTIINQVPGGAQNIADIYTLSPLQEGMLFHHITSELEDIYLSSFALKLNDQTVLTQLLKALELLVGRHDTLRTTFFWQGLSEPAQVVLKTAKLSVEYQELTPYDSDAAAKAQIESYRSPRMSLHNAPLLQLKVGKAAQREELFVLVEHHHLIIDHIGLDIFVEELSAIMQGMSAQLPQTTPYRNLVAYARAQNAQGQGLEYFKRKLADLDDATLLFDSRAQSESLEYIAPLDLAVADKLNQVSSVTGYSVAAIFHTAWALVAAQCGNTQDVVFGTVLSGRLNDYAATQRSMGLAINTLPVRVGLSELTVADALNQLSVSLKELINVEQTPLALALKAVDSSNSPFNSVLNYRHSHQLLGEDQLLRGMEILDAKERTNYPISINVDDYGGPAGFNITVQTANGASPQSIHGYFANALSGILECLAHSPETRLAGIGILSNNAMDELLFGLNDTSVEYAKDMCIHQLFEHQAQHQPERIAVSFDGNQLTYRRLNEKANQLAHYLIERHQVKPDSLVGLCLERSLEMVIAIVAILKAGGAYVPLDPTYPQDRLAYMLEDSDLDVVLSHTQVQQVLSEVDSTVVMLDGLGDCAHHFCAEFSTDNPQGTGLASSDLAYVIYTSGSTGKPKGVMVEHQALFNRINWMHNQYGMSPDDKVLQKTPYSFDVSVWEFVWTLAYGAELVVAKPEGHKDPEYLCQLIQAQKITKLHFVPSMLGVILESDNWQHCHCIKQVFCSGEALQQSHVLGFRAALPQTELHNLYGPTEAAIDVSYFDCAGDISQGVPIGKPIDNIQLVVLDVHLNLVPDGAVGELHIGGDGLARGYLGREELTKERFIDNPYYDESKPNSSKRLYKTGDLARIRGDGEIEYQGRTDHQVKIRGLRIELGEIEHQLAGLATVDSALVMATTLAGSTQLIGYLKPSEIIAANVQANYITEIKSELAKDLPEHMVPGIFMLVEQWPLTPNGKVDRKALAKPDGISTQRQYVEPVSETEKQLAEIWAELLEMPQQTISASANFFELGGHSLLVIKLNARLQKLNWDPAAAELYSYPVLTDMAAYLDGLAEQQSYQVPQNPITEDTREITPDMLPLIELTQAQIDSIAQQVPGGVANIQDMYPLAPLQEGLLYVHQLSDIRDPYVAAMAIECKDRQALHRFSAALQDLIARHDVLRTAIIWQNRAQAVQVVLREAQLPVKHLSGNEVVGDKASVLAYIYNGAFFIDLEKAPLIALEVVKANEGEGYYGVFKAHHLVSDHVSLEIFTDELTAILNGQDLSVLSNAPYRDFIAHTLYAGRGRDAKAFFTEQLANIESPTLPFEMIEVNESGSGKQSASVTLSHEISAQIRQVSKQYNVSPAAFFHSVWGMVLSAFTGQNTVVFGTVLTGRMSSLKDIDRMMGMTINTLPVVVSVQDVSAKKLLVKVDSELRSLLPYEQVPLAEAQRYSHVEGATPLFNSSLNYRHTQLGADVEATPLGEGVVLVGAVERNNYPLNLAVNDFSQGNPFSLDFGANAGIDCRRIISCIENAMETLLAQLTEGTDSKIDPASVLPHEEVEQLLYQFNDCKEDLGPAHCIHSLFEQQVELTPDNIAVVFEGHQVDYRQLNQKANQLAHYLKEHHDLQPDTLVGLCMERSLETVIAILAVLKTGAAYVPLDPGYPSERLSYMLEDAELTVVLSQTQVQQTLEGFKGTVLALDGLAGEQHFCAQFAKQNLALEQTGVKPSNLAYVIYTSGSTGKPKGVMIEHRNLVDYMLGNKSGYYTPAPEGSLIFTSLSFDLSLPSIYMPLINGQFVELATNHVLMDDSVAESLLGQSPRLVRMTPSHLQILLAKVADRSSLAPHIFVVGGEAFDLSVAKLAMSAFPNMRLYNHYGPSESTIGCTISQVSAEQLQSDAPLSIGKPMTNAAMLVLSAGQKLVAKGVAGELYIAGSGLARGYYKRPDLTAERFITNPYYDANRSGSYERLYRSGDLVRYLDDGRLEFIGRADDQVKIRGYRIELGEVETQLTQHVSVDSALVMAKELSGSTQLVAYVKLNTEQPKAVVKDISNSLKAQLPDYMVPGLIMTVDQWPLTSNGKVDRKALPAPDGSLLQGEFAAPQSKIEKVLAEVWAELLQLAPGSVSASANFFELGGHSLLSMKLVSLLNERGYALNINDLYKAPQLRELAQLLEDKADAVDDFVVPANQITPATGQITPDMLPLIDLSQTDIDKVINAVPGGVANIQDIYALAPLQEGMVFIHQVSVDKDPYVSKRVIACRDEAAFGRLLEGLKKVIARHDVLRTAILWREFINPVQVVVRNVDINIEYINIPGQDFAAGFDRYVSDTAHRIDLETAPLMQLKVAVDPNNGSYKVLINHHHLITDHMSAEVLIGELISFHQGTFEQLGEPSLYRDFVARTKHNLANMDVKGFFSKHLQDLESPTLLFEEQANNEQPLAINEMNLVLGDDLSNRVRQVMRQNQSSAAAFFHGAWGLVLSKFTGQQDVVFGTVLSGRMSGGAGIENAMGMMINTLPIRIPSLQVDAQSLVKQLNNYLWAVVPFEQVSLAEVQKYSGVSLNMPLFNACLNYRHTPIADDADLNGLAVATELADGVELVDAQEETNYPLMFAVNDYGDAHSFTFDLQMAGHIDVARIAEYVVIAIEQLLRLLESGESQAVAGLDILPKKELNALLYDYNQTSVSYDKDQFVHKLFEIQAGENPDNVAVVFENKELGYRQLNEKANQLASMLKARYHIAPDSLVGLCTERSLEMVIGIMAILKAGGAYVPLDPGYPQERLNYMLEDAALDVVLSQSHLGDLLSRFDGSVVNLDGLGDSDNHCCSEYDVATPDDGGLTTNNLAYVIYTSGSTGKPKGVMLEHQALFNRIHWMHNQYGMTAGDKVLQKTPYSFDVSVWEFVWTLAYGAQLIVAKPEGHKDPDHLCELIQSQQVTKLHFVPSMLGVILQCERFADCHSIEQVFCSGEALQVGHVQGFREALPSAQLHNLYGPTEAAIDVSYFDCSRDISKGVPIGRPIDNIQLVILDSQLNMVPQGAVGELHIGGDGLARGYLNREQLTRERFIDNPFYDGSKSNSSKRLYKTGDLARMGVGGEIEYQGRTDHQVKIRGLRIELGEIEHQLGSLAEVDSALVMACELAGSTQLVGYVKPTEPVVADAQADYVTRVKRSIGEDLPEYMVPAIIMTVADWPVTPNGKVDRKALPKPDGSALAGKYVAPQTDTEHTLVSLWSDMLDMETGQISTTANFFELGGHSLLLMRMLSEIKRAFELELDISRLFGINTLAELGELIDGLLLLKQPAAPILAEGVL